MTRRQRGERGTAAIELVLVAPVLIVIMLFVVGLGRMAHARQQIDAVAADSARAASLERNTAQSANAARVAAEASLGDAGVSCTELDVHVDLDSPVGRCGSWSHARRSSVTLLWLASQALGSSPLRQWSPLSPIAAAEEE